jgi:hypothetical protein
MHCAKHYGHTCIAQNNNNTRLADMRSTNAKRSANAKRSKRETVNACAIGVRVAATVACMWCEVAHGERWTNARLFMENAGRQH